MWSWDWGSESWHLLCSPIRMSMWCQLDEMLWIFAAMSVSSCSVIVCCLKISVFRSNIECIGFDNFALCCCCNHIHCNLRTYNFASVLCCAVVAFLMFSGNRYFLRFLCQNRKARHLPFAFSFCFCPFAHKCTWYVRSALCCVLFERGKKRKAKIEANYSKELEEKPRHQSRLHSNWMARIWKWKAKLNDRVARRETGKSSTSSRHIMNDMRDGFCLVLDSNKNVPWVFRRHSFCLKMVVSCVNAQKSFYSSTPWQYSSRECATVSSKHNFMQINYVHSQQEKKYWKT